MSAKRRSPAAAPRARSLTAREIISTCQIKTAAGTPVTWTAFRRVGAQPSAAPDCYLCTLPDNTSDETPSAYNLRSIATQARRFSITLTALDRDVVYLVSRSGGEPQRIAVPRGETFLVPPRGAGADATTVVLTFEGDMCTIEAVPQRLPRTTRTTEEEPGTVQPMDSDDDPPPPLPDGDSGE